MAGTIYSWTAVPSSLGVPTGGSGTWNLTGDNWVVTTGLPSVIWGNGSGDGALFGLGAGTVTLGANGIQANSLTFNTNGYTIAGGGHTLTLSGTSPAINAGSLFTETIAAPLSSSQVVNLGGAGTVNLTGGGLLGGIDVTAGGLGISGGNTLTLTGTGTALTVESSAAVSISGGSTLDASASTTAIVDGTAANATIDGVGSQLNTGFQLLVGNTAAGSLAVQNHGQLNASTFLLMGASNGSNGTLTIQSGGSVNSGIGILGYVGGATGAANVTGAGSTWSTGSLGLGGLTSTNFGGTGTLTISSGGAVNVTGATTLWTSTSSATINGGTLTTGTLASNGALGSIALQADPSGGQALVVNGSIGTGNYAGTITGAGSILKTGASDLQLAGANTFTGSTTINGGTITLGNGLALQNSSVAIGVNNGLNLNSLSSATLGGLSGSGSLNLGATALTVGGNNADSSYSGSFNATTGALTKQGSGTLTLSGGGTLDSLTVAQGKVAITAGTLTLTDSAIGLNVGGSASLNLSGGAVVNSGGAGELVDGTAAGITISGAGTKLTTGTELLVSQFASGSLTVQNQGQLAAGNLLVIGFDSGSNGTMLIQSKGTVSSISGTIGVLAGSTGTVTVTGAQSAWTTSELGIGGFNGAQNGGTGTLTIAGGGAVTVAGVATIWNNASSIVINGGTLTTGMLSSNGAAGSISLVADPTVGHALNVNGTSLIGTYAGTLSGAGSLTMSGNGSTQTLTGANTYTGPTLVSAGSLVQSGGTNNSRITVSSGGTFTADNGAALTPLGGFGALTAQSGGTVQYDNATVSGGFLSGTGTQEINAGGATFNGTTVNLGTTLTQNGASTFNDVILNGKVANNAALSWAGGSIGSGGVLEIGNTVDASGLTSNGEIDLQTGATLAVSGTDLALGNGSRTYIGTVSSPGGSLTLSGGVVQLDDGLLVNNGTISGEVDVNFGGLAEGAGTYGNVVINNGGQFHPGNSPGTVTSSAATWGAGGELLFDINDANGIPGTNWSLWDVTGQLDITAGDTPNTVFKILLDSLLLDGSAGAVTNFNPTRSYAWTFLNAGSITGFSSSDFAIDSSGFANALDGGSFSLLDSGQSLALEFTPAQTPEPSTAVLVLCALAVAWTTRQRARRSPRHSSARRSPAP